MIDTIKFLVPIDDEQVLNRIKSTSKQFESKDLKTGEVKFVFHTSEIKVGSYNKSINVRMVDNLYHKGVYIEFSIPKYAKGNNVEMIFPSELPAILEKFQQQANTQLDTTLPHFSTWQIFRIDLCYNWIFKTKAETETIMGFLQRLDYPRKEKETHNITGVTFKGSAYRVKFYLKGPEFKVHDFKELNEEEKTSDKTLGLLEWADKVVRFEVEFKKNFLKGIFGYNKVFVEHVIDDEQIEEILRYYLKDKVFKYVTLKNTTEIQVEELLYNNFKITYATKLYQFYRDFYLGDGAVKSRMLSGGLNRTTIWRYKTDLKKVGIGFDIVNSSGVSLIEQLVIPSGNSKFDLVGFPENVSWRSSERKVV